MQKYAIKTDAGITKEAFVEKELVEVPVLSAKPIKPVEPVAKLPAPINPPVVPVKTGDKEKDEKMLTEFKAESERFEDHKDCVIAYAKVCTQYHADLAEYGIAIKAWYPKKAEVDQIEAQNIYRTKVNLEEQERFAALVKSGDAVPYDDTLEERLGDCDIIGGKLVANEQKKADRKAIENQSTRLSEYDYSMYTIALMKQAIADRMKGKKFDQPLDDAIGHMNAVDKKYPVEK